MPGTRIIFTAILALLVAVLASACTDPATVDTTAASQPTTASQPPSWIEDVIPEPGAISAVPDAVEIDHNIVTTDEELRLIVDGIDVTAYAEFDAGKLRYESGAGPVELSPGDHTAEVQRVVLPADQTKYEVLDSYTWNFRVS